MTPTLLKLSPLPVQRVIGNLSDTEPGAPDAGQQMNAGDVLHTRDLAQRLVRGRGDHRGAALRPDRRGRRFQEPARRCCSPRPRRRCARARSGCATSAIGRSGISTPPTVMLLALDLDGRIMLVNRYACAVLGWTEPELLGRDWFETCLAPRTARAGQGALRRAAARRRLDRRKRRCHQGRRGADHRVAQHAEPRR